MLGFGGVVDPDERLSQTFFTGGGTNYAKFSDKELDELTVTRPTLEEIYLRLVGEADEAEQ